MVFINSEGKFNDNSYLIDGQLFRMKGFMAVYVIENKGMRMMIDTSSSLMTRKIMKKIKEFGLYPIHKLVLTHSHFDHMQGVGRLRGLQNEVEIEILASENAIDNLKNPERMNEGLEVDPVENITPLKDGDIIDLNGLKLEIFNFFGHTQDHITVFDEKNKNIFTGDAILNRYDRDTFSPTFMPPDFNESELFNTFEKLRSLKKNLNSISLSHFGVWEGEDFGKIINEMEDLHHQTKHSMIEWYSESHSRDYITSKYHDKFIPNSKIHTKENLIGLKWLVNGLIIGLKSSGYM